jgi:hydrogenase nickel incorporation protein HypB
MLFREAKAVLLNKIDLIPYTNFNYDNFSSDLKKLNGQIPVFEISCTKGDGLREWYKWIERQINLKH